MLLSLTLLSCIPKQAHIPPTPAPQGRWIEEAGQLVYFLDHQSVAWIEHAPVSEYIWGVSFRVWPNEPPRYFADKRLALDFVMNRCLDENCLPH